MGQCWGSEGMLGFVFSSHPPHSPPPLSRPAGRKRGANSHIWPRLPTKEVHAPIGVGARGRQFLVPNWPLAPVNIAQAATKVVATLHPSHLAQPPHPRRACTSFVYRDSQMGLLAPSFARRGERGRGARGGCEETTKPGISSEPKHCRMVPRAKRPIAKKRKHD
jgi:hypothetical protein